MSFEEYADLAGTGYQGGSGEKITPEESFYHSIYIAGKSRKNHINVMEEAGKLQVRGVQYNLDEVHIIITHTKEILCKIKNDKGKETIECFSFKTDVPPWYGTCKLGDGTARQCPQTSAERAINDFCAPCRAQILVAGIYCKEDGSPILTEENKPIFVFIRGKGMRYSNVSNYLNDCFQAEFDPIFEPSTDETLEFEKRVVNNKRCVTKITGAEEQSGYGSMVNIFELNQGTQLPNDSVMSILKLSKQTVSKFNEKFDWSKGKSAVGYGSPSAAPEGVMTIENEKSKESSPAPEESKNDATAPDAGAGKTFSFDDINF